MPEIDRLIEEGLTLYGQGDLDGALVSWDRALAISPDNAQVKSYVEYVRSNYDKLAQQLHAAGEATTSDSAPFGITEDEHDYQIEILPGEVKPAQPAPLYMDPQDDGWFIDDEGAAMPRTRSGDRAPTTEDSGAHTLDFPQHRIRGALSNLPDGRAPEHPSQELTLELEADEPPEPAPPPAPPAEPLAAALGLPDAHIGPAVETGHIGEPGEGVSFDDATREYQPHAHRPPPDHAVPASEFASETTPGFGHAGDVRTPTGFGAQTTDVRRRELGFVKPTRDLADPAGPPPVDAPLDLGLDPSPPPPGPEISEDSVTTTLPAKAVTLDLVGAMPPRRPARTVPPAEPDASFLKAATRDMPSPTRPPAFSTAPTRELSARDLEPPPASRTHSADFDERTKERAPSYAPPLVSAPTRDLGLRDEASGQRAAAAEALDTEGTRADVVLPFDPIDARAAQILDEIDAHAPDDEPREDRTRRRITALFDQAAAWCQHGDFERAVAAVDLALSEDPNSALAQKLIHRNRETMMTVFQTFLGDLQRQPQLARPLHELASAPISPRAAFLLSRIDGLLSIDEILDVCGMPRLEAYRYLCQLFLRGILR